MVPLLWVYRRKVSNPANLTTDTILYLEIEFFCCSGALSNLATLGRSRGLPPEKKKI